MCQTEDFSFYTVAGFSRSTIYFTNDAKSFFAIDLQ